MDSETQSAISSTLTQGVQTLTDYLKETEVVFNFLAISVSENQDMERTLIDFMKSIFGAAKEFPYLTAQVQLKHITHLWFIIRLAQAGRLVSQNQVTNATLFCSKLFSKVLPNKTMP